MHNDLKRSGRVLCAYKARGIVRRNTWVFGAFCGRFLTDFPEKVIESAPPAVAPYPMSHAVEIGIEGDAKL
jgi:hypothetical protein